MKKIIMLLWALIHSTSAWCLILPGTENQSEESQSPPSKDKNKKRRARPWGVKGLNYM